jgi:hypothetical protein
MYNPLSVNGVGDDLSYSIAKCKVHETAKQFTNTVNSSFEITLVTSWFPLGLGVNDNNCTAIAVDALSNIYIGGDYNEINNQSIKRISYYSSTNQTIVSAVPNALLRNGLTYTTLTFKKQYSTILLCYNGTEWVIVEYNPYVILT